MMRIKVYHILFVVVFVQPSWADAFPQLSIRASIGQGWYQMNDLHALLDETKKDFAFEGIALKATSAFPAYYNTQIQLLKKISPEYQVGLVWQHLSTGARLHYSDYSGAVQTDITVNADAGGIKNIWTVRHLGKSKFEYYLQLAGFFSNVRLLNELTVFDEQLKEDFTLKSIGLGIEPGISTTAVISRLSISFDVGYQQCFSRPLHLTNNKDATLRVNNHEATADWSGLRIGFCVGLSF